MRARFKISTKRMMRLLRDNPGSPFYQQAEQDFLKGILQRERMANSFNPQSVENDDQQYLDLLSEHKFLKNNVACELMGWSNSVGSRKLTALRLKYPDEMKFNPGKKRDEILE